MSYSKKIDETTCIFCGAPLTSDLKCNYCGCEYITQSQYGIRRKKLPDIIQWEAYKINIEHDKHFNKIIYRNQYLLIPTHRVDEIKVDVLLEHKYYSDIIALYFTNDFLAKRNIEIKYKNKLIILEQSIIEQYNITDTSKEKIINVKLIPNKYYIKDEDNGR